MSSTQILKVIPYRGLLALTSARHELHRAVDGDWSTSPVAASEQRRAQVMGLALVASLPWVALMSRHWSHVPNAISAAIAALPLFAVLLVAIAWRPARGRR